MENFDSFKKKVCIVDDEANIREIYETALKKNGYEVVTASNGAEGLKTIIGQKPDLILADIMMPEMNGVEMIREIRKHKELLPIPIVVMTNVDDRETIKIAGELETSFYLVKALFTSEKMADIVDEALQKGRVFR
ncbi:MAG: response regulator [Candidatus Moranbacteria bacterium]|nr:response regulator [Candidatus Moranbacteria bacterium]